MPTWFSTVKTCEKYHYVKHLYGALRSTGLDIAQLRSTTTGRYRNKKLIVVNTYCTDSKEYLMIPYLHGAHIAGCHVLARQVRVKAAKSTSRSTSSP